MNANSSSISTSESEAKERTTLIGQLQDAMLVSASFCRNATHGTRAFPGNYDLVVSFANSETICLVPVLVPKRNKVTYWRRGRLVRGVVHDDDDRVTQTFKGNVLPGDASCSNKDTYDVIEEEAVRQAAVLTYLLDDVTKERQVVRPIVLRQDDHVTKRQITPLSQRHLLQ